MGFWSGIKHALNSTLGTSEFKPLDKLVQDYIKSQRTYAPSDSSLAILTINEIAAETDEKIISGASFTSFVNGSLRVKAIFELRSTSMSSSTRCNFKIYKNGQLYKGATVSHIKSDNSSEYATKELLIDLPIEIDSKYEFSIHKTNGSSAGLNELSLCGQVVDLSMLNYTLATT